MRFFVFVCTLLSHTAFAQFGVDQEAWLGRLSLSGGLPNKLLGTRSITFYDYHFTDKELYTIQQSFQRTGIDAVSYFELDMLTAGRDITKAFSNYLLEREITNLIFIEKSDAEYKIAITLFNGKETVIDQDQPAWATNSRALADILQVLYRASSSQQKMNLLINDAPEQEGRINPIMGKRNEFFALDLKVDPLAVLKTGDEQIDKRLEEIFVNNYPLKFTMAEPGTSERDLRKQGLLYVLCFVHTRGVVAKELLGYDMSKSESALVSVTYPGDQQELRNIPSNTPIYKFYFKHIDSGNVFFGTKWDADITWEQALLNQLKGMKAELRLN